MDASHLPRFKEKLALLRVAQNSSAEALLKKTPLPLEIGLQLTDRCNLRCKECFQWGADGSYHSLSVLSDLPLELIERVLQDTASVQSSLYLWGGEPLMYSKWPALANLFVKHRRHIVLCTNGMSLSKLSSSICAISTDLVTMVSVDGLETENDAIRGRNTFHHALAGIRALLHARSRREYLGEIAVSCVVTNENVSTLEQFVQFFSSLQVNSIYLVFPWHISQASASAMDEYFQATFAELLHRELPPLGSPSWHHFSYHIEPRNRDILYNAVRAIRSRKWSAAVRFQPDVSDAQLDAFLSGKAATAQNRTRCISKFVRLSVLPNGDVTTCKLFPEFTVGNLLRQNLTEIWRGAVTREVLTRLDHRLTPVCGKCVQLYLHGLSSY